MTAAFFYKDGTEVKYKNKDYIVFDNFGYKKNAGGIEYFTSPDWTFDSSGFAVKMDKKSPEYKNAKNSQKINDHNTALTTPTAAPTVGVGLKNL
jgi:hypothetical protein